MLASFGLHVGDSRTYLALRRFLNSRSAAPWLWSAIKGTLVSLGGDRGGAGELLVELEGVSKEVMEVVWTNRL